LKAISKTSLAIGGGLGIAFGSGLVLGLKSAADHAKELSHQLSNIQTLGLTQPQVSAAIGSAFALPGQVSGMTSSASLQILSNINSIVGPEGARKMLGPLAQFGQAMGAQSGDYDKASENILKLVRSGDLLGKFVDSTTRQVDLNKLQGFLDLVAKVSAATHGMVGSQTWLAMAQQGGPALSSMTDEGLMSMAMVAQAMGGFRSGTAMTSLYQQIVGGKMTQYAAQELQGMGLVGGYSVGQGGHVLWDKGALDTPFSQALSKDPLAATEILRKAMESHGFTSIETQIPELFKMLGRQTTQRLVHDFLRNEPQMFGERGRMMKGAGVAEQLSIANATDYERNMHNLTAAWSEMMAQIGLPITKAAIPVMQTITSVFLDIAKMAPQNSETIKLLAQGIGVLSAALIGGGAIALLGALGPAGWIATGIIAVGGAVLTYGTSINKYIHDFSDGIRNLGTGIFEKVVGWVKSFGDAISELWGKLQSLNPFHHTSFEGGGFGGGGGIVNAAWSGGGGGVLPGGTGGGDMMGAVSSSAALRQYLATDGHGMNPQTTAWCAAYVGAYLNHHGYSSLASNVATSYLNYGSPVTDGVRAGDVVVLPGRHSAGQVGGHVGIATGRVSGGRIEMFAGNAGNRVAREWERLGSTVIRRPPPRVEPYRRHEKPPVIENTMYLDGHVLHHSVVKRIVRGMTHPTTAPYADGSRLWTPPDSSLVNV
jgi:hypothetical protein